MKNSGEENALHESLQRHKIINTLLRISLEGGDLKTQLEKAFDIILDTTFIRLEPKGVIFLKDENSDELILFVHRNLDPELLNICNRVPLGRCLCGRVAQTRKFQYVGSVDERHENVYEGMHQHGHYIVPILSSGNILGVMNLYIKEGHPYEDMEADFLNTVANILAGIIERKKADNRLQEKLEELEKINVTLSEREKELKILDEMKANFVSTISHELRTPLTSILGNTKLVIQRYDSMPDKEKLQFLNVVVQQGDHLLNLINDILDVASAESGHLSLERRNVDLEIILEESISFIDILAKEKNIKLHRDITSQEKEVYADPMRLRQIFVNLLSNSIKFTSEGGGIDVIVQDYVHSKEVLLVTVKDNGSGIPNNKIDVLFNRFIQVDNSPTRKSGGTGLGLTIIKELICLHGGRIWVESEEGVGSTFFFTILKSRK